MIESILVADRGPGAIRVVATCRRLGIKSVVLALSGDPTDRRDRAGADDVVLLHDHAETADPAAVVRAASAAGVGAVHPGTGPLAGSSAFADGCVAAGLVPVTTVGLPAPPAVWAELGRAGVPIASDATAEILVVALAGPSGIAVFGEIGLGTTRAVVPPPTAGAEARAATARTVLGLFAARGLVTVGFAGAAVCAVLPTWPPQHAALELVTGIDLVEAQLQVASGEPMALNEPSRHGAAVTTMTAVDLAPEDSTVAAPGVRVDVEDGDSGQLRARVTAWNDDPQLAADALAAYLGRAGPDD
ncbi:MAG: biotin carboxylase N-terminal domain-containing protein [bacterium]